MSGKSSSSGPGRSAWYYVIIAILALAIIAAVVFIVIFAGNAVWLGLKIVWPYLILLAALCIILPIALFRHRPLTYEQAQKLARATGYRYAKTNFVFSKDRVTADPQFKAEFNAFGHWTDIEMPSKSFPSYVASLLGGRRNEYSVVALQKDTVVRRMWVHTANDPDHVSVDCSISEILEECRKLGAKTVLLLHNHPNRDPEHYTTLCASDADMQLSKEYGSLLAPEGINFYSFVCAGYDFIQIYENISTQFEAPGYTVSDYVDRCGISRQMDYHLQREYRKAFRLPLGRRGRNLILAGIILVLILIGYIGIKYGL